MQTLKHFMKRKALQDIKSDRTLKQYKKNIDKFCEWAKEKHHIRLPQEVKNRKELVQEYADFLVEKRLSPSGIHTYLAPVCKGFSINMAEIEKPQRTAGTMSKSRDPHKNIRGKKYLEKDQRAQEIADAQSKIGIRKAELFALRGRNLKRDDSGNLCVEVERGKGGKFQMQRVLPADEESVIKLFEGKAPDQRIFSDDDRKAVRYVDLHSIRAQHARDCYDYYKKLIDQGDGDRLREELIYTFEKYHIKDPQHPDRFERQLVKFKADMKKSDGIYLLRGENRDRAIKEGRPLTYDRLALLCVSVWHLSHWRNDVTIKHYML